MTKGPRISPYLIIAVFGALLFLPMLGAVHLFDWDEINFAESAREMLVTGDYGRVTINYQPFWEKPPLFIWMQALSMSMFGINEFAARLPNALCGIATLMVLFHYGKRYRDESFGWFWVLIYLGTWLPHAYFKSGIIDPVFNLFMFLGVVQLAQWAKHTDFNKQMLAAVLTGLFIGLAVLTKGPVGLLLPGLAALAFMLIKRRWFMQPLPLVLAVLVFLVVTFAWYGMETVRNGWWFLGEFITYNFRLAATEDSGHGGFPGYHFVVLLLGCFPASILMFYKPKQTPEPSENQDVSLQDLRTWMWLLLAVVLVVFTIVQTKIVHYSSLAYFPITFLAASTLYRWRNADDNPSNGMRMALATGVLLFGAIITGGCYFMATEQGWTKLYATVNQSRGAVPMAPWPMFLVLIGLVYLMVAAIGIRALWRGQAVRGMVRIFIATAIALQLLYILVLPRVEPLTQGAMITFLKEHAQEDVYINTLGFKSYAHYYYGGKMPSTIQSPAWLTVLEAYKQRHGGRITPQQFNDLERWWHLEGGINKPVLFIAPSRKSQKIQNENPQLYRIGEGGGYMFFRRDPRPKM